MLCGIVIGLASTPLGAQDSQDLLESDQAFAFSAQVISPEKVAVTWNIAPRYYMYLDKFSFDSDGGTDSFLAMELEKIRACGGD